MKKYFNLLCGFSSLLVLSGCVGGTESSSNNPNRNPRVQVLSVIKNIYAGIGDIRVVGSDFVIPFDTGVTGNLYYYEGDYNKAEIAYIQNTFQDSFIRYHALSDRHYDYFDFTNSEEGVKINNVKVINDSYGSEVPINVEPYLYDLLKTSYDFTLNSNGKFNMFLGGVSSLYEKKLDEVIKEEKTGLNAAFIAATDLQFSDMSQELKNAIDETVASIPKTKEELEGLLTFDDEKRTVTFHRYKNDNKKPLEISLGGNAKGFATEYICNVLQEKYPEISMLVNSGFSSIKTLGTRPDGKPWNIRYNNPAYNENLFIKKHEINEFEVSLSYLGSFNLSTSGYYNQYFYDYEDGNIQRRNHIVNPQTGYSESFFDQVSVFIDDTGLADMYTTALMNCKDVREAKQLFTHLNDIYQEENAQMLLCYKADKSDYNTPFAYSMSDFDNLSSLRLPICELQGGTLYEGNYQDIKASEIVQSKSTFAPQYQMVYQMSDMLYENSKIIEDLQYPKNVLAKRAKL
jgi:lipoprotein